MRTDFQLVLFLLCAASPRAVSLQVISQDAPSGCKTAVEGDDCYRKVMWAMQFGINENPEWYGQLTNWSSFDAFQQFFYDHFPEKGCSAPCQQRDTAQREMMQLETPAANFAATGSYQEKRNLDASLMQASLSHTGLERVLDAKIPSALQLFVKRLLESDGREVGDWSGLKQFCENTLKRSDLQRKLWAADFEIFTTEVRASAWVDGGAGRDAPLTPSGFERVTRWRDDMQTANFLRRLADEHGLKVTNEVKFGRVAQIFAHAWWTFDEVKAMILAGSFVSPK